MMYTLFLALILFWVLYFHLVHNLHCSVVSLLPMPLRACGGAALSREKQLGHSWKSHSTASMLTKQHCHLVLDRQTGSLQRLYEGRPTDTLKALNVAPKKSPWILAELLFDQFTDPLCLLWPPLHLNGYLNISIKSLLCFCW